LAHDQISQVPKDVHKKRRVRTSELDEGKVGKQITLNTSDLLSTFNGSAIDTGELR